jgi:hypothetical protein
MLSEQPRSLLSLPLEIREVIYKYLCPPARLPTILRSRRLGVSSATHRPPPLSLLLANYQLSAEALDVYYRITTFQIEGAIDTGNVWCLWQIEDVLGGSDLGIALLKRMRKVELCFFWHRLPVGGVSTGPALANAAGYGNVVVSEIEKRKERVQRVIDVLERAQSLGTILISWKEVPRWKDEEEEKNAWEVRQQILSPLERVKGVRFLVEDCVASAPVEAGIDQFVRALDSRVEERKPTPLAEDDVSRTSRRERAVVIIFLFVALKFVADEKFCRIPFQVEQADTSAHHRKPRRNGHTLSDRLAVFYFGACGHLSIVCMGTYTGSRHRISARLLIDMGRYRR